MRIPSPREDVSDNEEIEDEDTDLEGEMVSIEYTLVKAKAHVRQYQAQREQAKYVISIAEMDITNHLPSLFRRRCLTIDMRHNLAMSNFEGGRLGYTYYKSPLTFLLFGVVDNTTDDKNDKMNAYI